MSKIILTVLIALNTIAIKSQEISHEDIYNLLLHSCGNYNLIGWGEAQKLHSQTPSVQELFGFSVSIFGDQLVVGRGGLPNAATVYEKENDVWVHKVTLSRFNMGQIVDITTDRIIVGGYGPPGSRVEPAFIYEKDENDLWSESASLSVSNPGDYFGVSVGISGDYAVVSDHSTDADGIPGAGAVYVYERDSNGWSQKQKIIAADPAAGDYFGVSVDIDGELIAVGAQQVGDMHGAVYVFKRNDQGIWIQMQKISGPTDVTYLFLGKHVSISGGMIVARTSGEYAFIYEATGDYTFTHTATLSSGSGGDVSISEYGEVIIGNYQDDNINGDGAGSVSIFNKVNGKWTEEDTIISSDSGDAHAFGYAVSISGQCAAIGKPGSDADGLADAGSVYIYCHDHSAHDNSNVVNIQPGGDYINAINNWIFPAFSILFVIVFLNIFMIYYILYKKTYNNSHQYEPAKRIDELDK